MRRLRISLQVPLIWCAWASVALAGAEMWTQPARYRFEYRVDVTQLGGAPPERLRIWVPYPAETLDQKVVSAEIDAPWPHSVHQDAYGNQILYFEGHGLPPAALTMRYIVERRPSTGVRPAEMAVNPALDPNRHLHPDQLVPLDGVIGRMAEEQSRGLTTDREKVRAFYDYVVKTMRYNKDGTGWGRGDAIWACTNKRGNCTDFHSLFIGMVRSARIPARFLIGFPIPDADSGPIPGYHCWAEYYDQPRGWVPVDASEANKSGRPDAYFGTLPSDRIQFTVGRDLMLVPAQQGPPLNYFIYPYLEADGTPLEKPPTEFRFERLPVATARP